MKLVLSILLSFFSISAFAVNGYKLKMNVLLNGKIVSSPEVVVEQGKKATLTQEDSKTNLKTNISILAKEGEIQGNKGILLDLEIAHLVGKNKKIVTTPQLLVSEGKEALFETANINGSEKFELKVIATKVKL